MVPLRIVASDGSMQETILGLMARAGLPVRFDRRRKKEGVVEVDWVQQIAFQRPYDIPRRLKDGQFDVAIVGQDWIANWDFKFPELLVLPIGRGGNKPVRIVLAVPVESNIRDAAGLPSHGEVATEYVLLAKRYFGRNGRKDIRVAYSPGNTEDKPRYGSHGIIDVVESGESLRDNDLRIIDELMESNTVIVANTESQADPDKARLINHFVRLIRGAYQASQYILLIANVPGHVLEQAASIIGGLKGPTVSPLYGQTEWWALQSFVRREKEQMVIFALLDIGVTDIAIFRDPPLIMS